MTARTAGLTALAMLAFASNSLLCRAALSRGFADATSFTTIRVAAGALALSALVRWRATGGHRDGGWVPALALFAYALGFSLAYLRIPAATGALLLFAAVQVTMVGQGLVSGERPGLREWIGLALSIAGLVVLTRPGLARPDPLGAGLMLLAGIAWGLYSLRGRGASDPLHSNALSFARRRGTGSGRQRGGPRRQRRSPHGLRGAAGRRSRERSLPGSAMRSGMPRCAG